MEIVNRFDSKLVKIIKDVNGRFDDYSIHLRLDKSYCIEAINQLKVIYYDLIFNNFMTELFFSSLTIL